MKETTNPSTAREKHKSLAVKVLEITYFKKTLKVHILRETHFMFSACQNDLINWKITRKNNEKKNELVQLL